MKPKTIRISPELGCWPLWDESGNNVDPALLDLPDDLVQSLNELTEWYDSSFDLDDPAREFWSEDDWHAFAARYRDVLARLRQELQRDFVVENRWPYERHCRG